MRKLMSVRACGIIIASALVLALVACGGGGSSGGADTSTSTSATPPAVAPATDPWWPPVIHAVGEKVTVSTSSLSPSAQKIGDTAWQQAVKDGTVKAVDTGATLTGFSTRPMVWAVYFHPTDKNGTQIYCTRPVYKDDGLAVGSLEGTQGNCTTEIIDWVVGTKAVGELKGGIIRHSPVRKECYELFWNQTRQGFDDHQVTCPIF